MEVIMWNNSKLTFSSVCKRISKKKYDSQDFVSDMKLLLEIAGCFFGTSSAAAVVGASAPAGVAIAAGGVTVAAVIAAISKKSKVLDGVKRIVGLLSKDNPSYVDRYEHMQDAYALLCVASFFDAYANTIPKEILSKIEISASEQAKLVQSSNVSMEIEGQKDEPTILLPNIVYGYDRVYKMLNNLYLDMTERLQLFIANLAFWEESDEKTQLTISQKLHDLPEAALQVFKSQYLTLCSKYSDFYAYVNLEKEIEYTNVADEQHKKLVEMILHSEESVNQNFESFANAIKLFPAIQREHEALAITEHIKEKYTKAINRTIVTDEDDKNLEYPTIEKAFIPQQYRLLEYNSKDTRLELESEWVTHDVHNDMLAYWARYVLDPQSTDHIFLVLGDPGGGKSLLMEMVSARLSSDAELVVKIPLRKYSNMGDMRIENMLCEQIAEDGDSAVRIDTFKYITGNKPERPFTLIFDGYDEVQQATGRAFRRFLKDLKDFQFKCKEEGRPVRIIVTSRRTLIDKADIPIGTTVMKLLGFNNKQKNKWIDTWNACNHKNLQSKGLNDFVLPKNSPEIDELAGQPLLLLMLAIYDADFETNENALQRKPETDEPNDLNRMALYDKLIRRFVRRELWKGKRGQEITYKDADDNTRKRLIDAEINKLGIAAFGMFIREKLSISVPELKKDFAKYNTDSLSYLSEGAMDSNEVFFGSFFFIHDSRIEEEKGDDASRAIKELEKDASFVFLHKTFYEFLVADFVLSSLYKYIIDLAGLKKASQKHYKNVLESTNGEFPQFYLTASGASLCVEPEIIKMIAEWGQQKLSFLLVYYPNVSDSDTIDVLGDIVDCHVMRIKLGKKFVDRDDYSLFPDRPIPQRYSIYMINLITLKALISEECRIHNDIWNYVAQYVKLNVPQFKENNQRTPLRHQGMDPSEELPLRFMALFQINKESNSIIISRRKESISSDERTPLDAKAEVLLFMQDNLSRSLYSLLSSKTSRNEKIVSAKRISAFDYTVSIDTEILKLQDVLLGNDFEYSSDKIMHRFIRCLKKGLADISRIIIWLILFSQVINERLVIEDYPRSRKNADIITQLLFRRLKNGLSDCYDDFVAVLKLWIGILKKLNLTTNIIDLFEYALRSMDFETDASKRWLLDVVRAIPYGYAEDYHYRYSWKYHNRYNSEHIYKYSKNVLNSFGSYSSPKVLAALLEADRKLRNNNYEYIENIDSKKIVNYIMHEWQYASWDHNDNRFWNEMPLLLRELVIRGENNYVLSFLNRLNLDSDIITDSAIIEYVSLADVVFSKEFLSKTVRFITNHSNSHYPSFTIKAFFYALYSLLNHSNDSTDETIASLLNYREFISRGIAFAPTQIAKLMCLILRHDNERLTKDVFYIVQKLLMQYELLLKQSPTTAIELLSLSANVFSMNQDTIDCYQRIANLEGYSELIDHFFNHS